MGLSLYVTGVEVMNVAVLKKAIEKKCKECVGEESVRYKAGSSELIEHCSRKTCGLYPVRPRIKKGTSLSEQWVMEIINNDNTNT